MKINELIYRMLHPRTINIHSKWNYPSCALSNFAEHTFYVHNVRCNSMEGFLQSLKFEDVQEQQEVCLLAGIKAKLRGQNKDWKSSQILYWQGVPIKRCSGDYQQLLEVAYSALGENEVFRKALLDTGNKKLRHTIGSDNPCNTILTEKEFCTILDKMRTKMKRER